MSETQHPLMTVNEAADRLKCSGGTVRKWLSKGLLKTCKIGGKTFVKRAEVELVIERTMYEENGLIIEEKNAE